MTSLRLLASFSVVVAGSLVAVSSGAVAAHSPRLVLVGDRGAPLSSVELHRGGVDVLGLAMTNPGPAPTVHLGLPAGTQLHSLSSYDATTGRSMLGTWACTSGTSVSCRYRAGPEQPPAHEIAYAVLVSGAGARSPVDPFRVRVRASLAGGVASSSLPATFESTNVPSISLGRSATPLVANGGTGSVAYRVRVLRGAALDGSGASPVTLTNVLPSGVVRSWSVASPGWNCVGTPSSSPTCSYDVQSVPDGGATSPLVVRYEVRPDATSRPRTLEWSAHLLVAGPYGLTMSRPVPSRVSLQAHVVESLKVDVRPLGGQSVSPGSRRQVEIVHVASDGVASGLADTIVVPKGLRLLGEHRDGWTCPSGAGTLTCRHPAPILTSAAVPLVVTVAAAADAPSGLTIVAVLSRALDGSVKNAGLAMLDVRKAPTTPTTPRPSAPTSVTSAPARVAVTPTVVAVTPTIVASPPSATAQAPARGARAQTLTSAPSTALTPRVTTMPTSLTLGGVTLSSISGTIDSTGTFTGTAAGSLDGTTFNVDLTFLDSSDWTFAVQTSQSVSILGQSLALTGSMSDGSLSSPAGTLSGALSVTLATGTTYDGLTFAGSLSAAASSGSAPTFTGSITLGFNAATLAATVTYTDVANWSVQLAGTDVLSFALGTSSGSLAVSGTIGEQGGTLQGSISGTTTTPFTLTNDVTATGSLSFAFTSGAASASPSSPLSFSGSMTILIALQSGSISLPVSFSYTDPTNWTASLALNSSTGMLPLTPTFNLPLSSLSGTVSMTQSGFVAWGLSASVSTVSLVPGVATLNHVTVSIGNHCSLDSGGICPAPGTNGVVLMAQGSLDLTFAPGVSASSLTFAVSYGFQTGAFDLMASLGATPLNLVGNVITLNDPVLEISYHDPTFATLSGPIAVANEVGTSAGLNVVLAGVMDFTFAGTSVTQVLLQVAYTGGGFDVVGSVPDGFTLGTTWVQINAIGYFTQSTTLNVNGATVNAPADTFLLAGSLNLPTNVDTFLGAGSSISIYALYSGPSDFQISATLNMKVPAPPSADFLFSFTSVQLTLGMNSGGLYFEISANGTLTFTGAVSPSGPQMALASATLSYDFTTSALGIAFSVTGEQSNQPALVNAFGYTDLNLDYLTIGAGVSFATGVPTPSFGISASGTLPASVTSDLGIGTGAKVQLSFALNVSATSPCIQVAIGQMGGPSVIDIGSGMLTASYAMFSAAPAGCTIGATTVPRGFAVAFSGTFLQMSVAFSASIAPDAFDGSASVSGFSVGGFTLQGSSIKVMITPTSFSFTFNGAIQILSPANQVNLSGSVDSKGDLLLRGSANLTLDGFSLVANVIAERYGATATVYANGSLNVLGQNVNISGFFNSGSSGVRGSLSGYAHVKINGYDLGNMTFDLELLPAFHLDGGISFPESQTLTAYVAVNLGPLGAATLSGAFTHSGAQVGVYLSASVAANLGAVSTVSGTVTVGNCSDSSCANVGNFGASLAGSFTWQGKTYGFSGAAVAPSWNFSVTSNGSINTGSGTVNTGLDQYRAWFSGNYTVRISSSSPYVAYSASVNAAIQHVGGHLKSHCTGNANPKTWHCSTYVVWGNWNTFVNVGASMDSQGNLSASYFGRSYSVRI